MTSTQTPDTRTATDRALDHTGPLGLKPGEFGPIVPAALAIDHMPGSMLSYSRAHEVRSNLYGESGGRWVKLASTGLWHRLDDRGYVHPFGYWTPEDAGDWATGAK